MKVLEPGKKDGGWSGEYRCTGAGNGSTGCGAMLLVELNDVFRTESSARDEITRYLTFRCPECGMMTDIDSDLGHRNVPQGVWDRAQRGIKHPAGGYCHPDDPTRFQAAPGKPLKDE